MTPELFSAQWFSALVAIVLIDLVLAGDNAIVIGLAARHIPAEYQHRVVLWGTAGAIVVRAVLTLGVVWLLKIPAFLLIGGLALVYIGWKLTEDRSDDVRRLKPASTVRGAVQTTSSPTRSWGWTTCSQWVAQPRDRSCSSSSA